MAANQSDGLDIPPFLRRGGKEWAALVKKTAKLVEQGKSPSLVDKQNEDDAIHALAAELGFRRHHYRVEWFRDPRWVADRMAEKTARDAAAKAKAETREETRKRVRAEKALIGGGNKVKRQGVHRAPRVRGDTPHGRIVWCGGENPKKEGTSAHARWAKLIACDKRSVESYLFDGGNPTTLANALKQGRCKVLSDADIEREGVRLQGDTEGALKKKGRGAGGPAVADGGADREAGAGGAAPSNKTVKRSAKNGRPK